MKKTICLNFVCLLIYISLVNFICCCSCNDIIDNEDYERKFCENYLEIDKYKNPEFIIDFENLNGEDKKIKYRFLSKQIEWSSNWCWMISAIQSLFSVPCFFEYIANSKFEDEKLIKLQKLLIEMIENEDNSSTSVFSKEKFRPYYEWFIKDKIPNTYHPTGGDVLVYFPIIKLGEKGSFDGFIQYLNILNVIPLKYSYKSYDNSNILALIDDYGKYTRAVDNYYGVFPDCNEYKEKLKDFLEKKYLPAIILKSVLGDIFIEKILNQVPAERRKGFRINTMRNEFTMFNIVFFLNNWIKDDFREALGKVSFEDFLNTTTYDKNLNYIIENYDFQINSIIVYFADSAHMVNINYNYSDECFYSYDSFHNSNIKQVTKQEISELLTTYCSDLPYEIFVTVASKSSV